VATPTRRRVAVVVVAGLALVGAWALYRTLVGRPFRETHLLQRVALELYRDDPDSVARAGIGDASWWDVWSARFTDSSPAREERLLARKRKLLALLRSYPLPAEGTPARLSHEIVEWYLDNEVRGEAFVHHGYLVESYEGIQSGIVEILTELHPLQSEAGARAYVARLHAVPTKIDTVVAGLRYRADHGLLAPRWSLDRVATGLRAFLAVPPRESVLVAAFARKSAAIVDLDPAARERLLGEAERAVGEEVYPAYGLLLREVEAALPRSQEGDGVWRLPDGAAYYAHLLRTHTTTDLSAEEIHRIGLEDVKRLTCELDAALRALGRTEGTPAERMRALAREPGRTFDAGKPGRLQLLDAYRAGIAAARSGAAPLLRTVPGGEVDVRPVPVDQEDGADAAHGAVQSGRMILFVNAAHPEDVPRHSVAALVFHETFPGHFVQRSIQRSMTGVPLIRKVLPLYAFADGWAVYSERLGRERELIPESYAQLGGLQSELWRAVRLVVDTGIHSRRWSREQAIAFFAATTGQPDTQVAAEVERYVLNPGQACAYMIGMRQFLELRDLARERLGERFRYPEFHQALLADGPMPLPLLQRRVEAWLAIAPSEHPPSTPGR
jgi:uncharacterized protein (DUF885 family)